MLAVDGEDAAVEKAIADIEALKGEPPLALQKAFCETCKPSTPALRAADGSQVIEQTAKTCIYSGTAEGDLPGWFRKRPAIS